MKSKSTGNVPIFDAEEDTGCDIILRARRRVRFPKQPRRRQNRRHSRG